MTIADRREHPVFSVFAGPVTNLDPVGELDWPELLAAVREGQHPKLGDWRGALPMDKEGGRQSPPSRKPWTPSTTRGELWRFGPKGCFIRRTQSPRHRKSVDAACVAHALAARAEPSSHSH